MEHRHSVNYFTCTLGEANNSRHQALSEFETVSKLIELQAERHPDLPAVAFPDLKSKHKHDCHVFTFRDLHQGSLKAAESFSTNDLPKSQLDPPRCVALLCHSSIDFLFAWLGLIRAGFSVLLIAPQCSPPAIAALCRSCEVSLLYHDIAHLKLASSAAAEPEFCSQPVSLPWESSDFVQLIGNKQKNTEQRGWPDSSSGDVAYIHHSSGTSTGVPKPVPQTHHGAVAVLPCLQGQNDATFTTTPLYHGGIADCFRAWTSNALIWLFPGADSPITSETILSCLSISKTAATGPEIPAVKYFSSVPYVLQMLSETSEGLKALQEMDMVGVGGAALPKSIGDRLVDDNVRLVSRFGSAECGFVLSSPRDYRSDKDWQYLRVLAPDGLLRFEKDDSDSGLFELVISASWPHMAKRNRNDGSYATCDLFERHSTIKNAWRYHSRSDSQITLLTGKKFDPAPIEEDVKSSSSSIADVLVFGNDRQMPGALIFPSSSANSPSEVATQDLWKIIQDVNLKQQSHARISHNMFRVLSGTQPPLERSSKGTLLRGQAEKLYATVIDSMYQSKSPVPHTLQRSKSPHSDESVEFILREIILEVMGEDFNITDDSDFFHLGVDSTKATQIRSLLQQIVADDELPWNIVYDCGNMKGLVRYFTGSRDSDVSRVGNNNRQEMLNLVEKYSSFNFSEEVTDRVAETAPTSRTVILTGATGSLGAHVLHSLRGNSTVSRVICLVRAADHATAWGRVSRSLTQRRLCPLPSQNSDEKVWCIPTQLNEPKLGLTENTMVEVQQTVTHIIHTAWAVNFSLPLSYFAREHLSGLQNLINFAASCRNLEQIVFCSSTASVLSQAKIAGEHPIPEKIYLSTPLENSLGYSKSKWVAEAICSKAAESSLMSGKVKVLRIGQLTGDTKNGVWNRSEAWPLMMSAALEIRCLPKIDQKLSWLPVDIAAQAVIDVGLLSHPKNEDELVYHLVNNNQTTSWTDLLRWINKHQVDKISFVEPSIWLDELEKLDCHPAKSLLGLWRGSFEKSVDAKEINDKILFGTKKAESASPSMREVGPVDEVLVGKIWFSLQGIDDDR